MSIRFFEENQVFHLDTAHTSLVLRVLDGHLMAEYWGARIRPDDLLHLWTPCPSGFHPNYAGAPDERYALDLIPTICPVTGSGDFRSPMLEAEFPDGSRILDLRYAGHTIIAGGVPLPHMPQLDTKDETLVLTLIDPPTGLKAELRLGICEEEDVIASSLRVINETAVPVILHRALSFSFDLPDSNFDRISLPGTHLREREIDRKPLQSGLQAAESRRGASSHQQNPFIALARPHTTEQQGEVYAAALIYSGNFIALAEVDPFASTRMQIGINPFAFTWTLQPGEEFLTPEAVATFSDNGLGGMSRNFHRVFRQRLGRLREARGPHPIVINSWEASYFDFDEEKLCDIIRSSKGLGIDMFVLDDGWFGHRDTDNCSLGDWVVDRRKLPGGLDAVIDCCTENGLQFGLWFEPEMISPDSDLFRAHPDWAIRHPDRPYCLGRNQLVLDLSRDEVREYLREAVGAVLRAYRIAYVKWDMNRHITDAYSAALPPAQQAELPHRYMLNLYRLLEELEAEFPDVIFEGCSGGGGRFDAGLLYYMPHTWTSDNSDAISRLKIQYGTSLVYPPECMTAHVSVCPNHAVRRVTPFATRELVAASASFGYELNPLSLTDEERAQIAGQTARYKARAELIVNGDFYRLADPFTNDGCGWCFVSPDRSRAFALYVQQLHHPNTANRRLKLAGLDPDARYHIEELNLDANGDALMHAGIALPYIYDFEARAFTLTKI